MQKNNPSFEYSYSAKEQREVESIRKRYLPPTEDKIERLRRLDRQVTEKAQVVSLIFGVVGTLVLGLGMSLIMSDLSELLGAIKNLAFVIGIICGVLGAVLVGLAYPAYKFVLEREKARVAPEILRLSDELLKK